VHHTPIIKARHWTSDSRVRRLLNSFITRPAPLTTIPAWDRVDRRETTYTGFRIKCLHILRAAILDPQFLAAEAAGDTAMVDRILSQPTVEQAVDRVQPNSLTTVYVAESGLSVAA